MALNAKKEFPDIDFNKSVMIGDSISDLIFGKNLNMKTVFIADTNNYVKSDILAYADFFCADMMEFTNLIR
jgi:histidinol phosphatase-like enzyme